ncbi:MAG: sulfotransferase [Planctomycetaceae bacterium]|jgi:hypothetical protein|nr:sulfotransferase [Planctomycetaceae bacterium]
MSSSKNSSSKNKVGGYTDRFWYPRFWDGMTTRAWFRLLKSGRFRVSPIRWGMVLIVTLMAIVFNSPCAAVQTIFYGKRIRQTKLAGSPIFIIGHWRSGTTLLHEYLIRDPRFTFADTYACFAPEHFIASRYILRPIAALLMPKKRPIDNMEAGFDRPQEDEFALTSMGLPSPYRNIIFPNNVSVIDTEYLTLCSLSEQQRQEWLQGLDIFLKSLTYLSPDKRIVLKSPPHTGRIRTILQQYPDAKFVHIHRHPYSIFPSTYNLWMRLAQDEGAQKPKGNGLEDYIFDTFNTMYKVFEADLELLNPNQFCEIAYKELTENPVVTLEKIYQCLELGEFETVQPMFTEFSATQKSYQKNKFDLSQEMKEQITNRWHHYFERYGYEK